MEKDFMFQSLFEGSRGLDFNEEDVQSIPLPTELPEKVDRNDWPEEVLKSSAVDSLINQNEDLLSRLAVQIRRNSLLEEKVIEAQNIKEEAEKQRENLNDQVMVLKQKDSLTKNRYLQLEQTIVEQKEKLEFLEAKYTEYYSTTQSNLDTFRSQLKSEKRRVSNYQKYRNKIRPLYKEVVEFSTKLKKDLLESESARTTAQKQLGEAAEHIQSLNKNHLNELKELRQTLNSEIDQLKKENTKLVDEKFELERKLKNHNNTYEENISLKNESLRLKRLIETEKGRTQEELEEAQQKMTEYRQDAKSKAIEIHNLTESNTQLSEDTKLKEKALVQLQNQVENLQLLWKESQEKAEKLEEQNKSLQKLNRQLSEKLHESRLKIKKIHEQAETQSLLVAKSLEMTESQKPSDQDIEVINQSEEVMEKINQLLHEIQSGFNNTNNNPMK